MRIGIYGGSFNPPHLGHLAAARAAAAVLGLDRLLIVPASDPPHKELPEGSPTPDQRLEMARIFADQLGLPGAECWDVEIGRAGKSYTVDTLETAKTLWPEDELWLLMGTDMFLTLQYWKSPERIFELAGVCAFGRTEKDSEELFAPQREFLARKYGAKITTLSIPNLVEVSSTEIREVLARGEGGDWLPEAVYGYILRRGLYGTFADLERLTLQELRCVAASMVKAKRLPHIRGTEETAVGLARRWGANPETLRRAAILHDCTKYFSLEEDIAICDQYGVPLDELERVSEKLLHAKSGAALARYVFGQSMEVFQAILYHTTARGNMTTEEKILYLADYIEPNRDFPEVEEMRRLAEESLDRAVLFGVQLSIREMLELNRVVHHNTLEAEVSLSKGLAP